MFQEIAAGKQNVANRRWARVSDPAPGPTAGLLNCGTVVILTQGDLRSACVARSETGHSA